MPSNSFGNEQGGNNQIAQNYIQTGMYKFPVTKKGNVKSPDIHPLYSWLTSMAQNAMMNSEVTRPCFKYLINKNGQLRGVYGPRIRPMSSILRNAIENIN
jgi:glutathione peroxidase